ncbi:hypothetical protein [Crossiella equi]|uniref:hypothetical protein n=1 Tax=Crossiella equi TaxID=130796 RepID=UPI000A38E578|nr:hypothetical protein [Crossiella equi]
MLPLLVGNRAQERQDPHGSRALKACLPPELYRTFVATRAREPANFAFPDGRLGQVLTLP